MVDFINHWHSRGFSKSLLLKGIELARSKYYEWQQRYGKLNEHNGKVPRDYWLQEWEKEKIVEFYLAHPSDGYRRACYMMVDQDIVAVSPATTYRVLKNAGVIKRWNTKEGSKKGSGFKQPLEPHDHWHIDISYLNICGTFYYFIGILDGCSRYLVHWEIRSSMKEEDVALVLQSAKEKFPQANPRIISDNGPQFIAKDFKEFIRISGMTHVRTSPYYPQSNGKLERFHKTLKNDCIRPKTPLSLEDANSTVQTFVQHYNNKRLHSSIGYIAPVDKLHQREQKIFDDRDAKLFAARQNRKIARSDTLSEAA